MMRATTEVTVSALAAMVVHAVARGLDAIDVVVEIDEPEAKPSPRRDCEIDEPIAMRPTEAADRVAELEREVERLRARLSAAHDVPPNESHRQQCAACLAVWDAIPPDVTSLTACAGHSAKQVAVDYVRAAGAARAAGWRAACERIAKECDDAHRTELALARDYEACGLRGAARDYEARAETAAKLARAARRIANEGL